MPEKTQTNNQPTKTNISNSLSLFLSVFIFKQFMWSFVFNEWIEKSGKMIDIFQNLAYKIQFYNRSRLSNFLF